MMHDAMIASDDSILWLTLLVYQEKKNGIMEYVSVYYAGILLKSL